MQLSYCASYSRSRLGCGCSSRGLPLPQRCATRLLQHVALPVDGLRVRQRLLMQPPRVYSSDPEANQEFCLQLKPITPAELERDKEWIAAVIASWLDEEWTPLEVHTQLGAAAADAYAACRQAGDDDMSSLVLGLSNELLSFNYRDTFVNAFEVSNKVVEMLMMRSGINVCCTTEEDQQRLERFSSSSSSDSSS